VVTSGFNENQACTNFYLNLFRSDLSVDHWPRGYFFPDTVCTVVSLSSLADYDQCHLVLSSRAHVARTRMAQQQWSHREMSTPFKCYLPPIRSSFCRRIAEIWIRNRKERPPSYALTTRLRTSMEHMDVLLRNSRRHSSKDRSCCDDAVARRVSAQIKFAAEWSCGRRSATDGRKNGRWKVTGMRCRLGNNSFLTS